MWSFKTGGLSWHWSPKTGLIHCSLYLKCTRKLCGDGHGDWSDGHGLSKKVYFKILTVFLPRSCLAALYSRPRP